MMSNQLLVSNEGADRSTAYHMSTKFAMLEDELWITWLANPYEIRISRIDLKNWKVAEEVPLVQGYDNHSGASLAVDCQGRLHVIAGSHHQSFIHRFSSTPSNSASWSVPHAVGQLATYPSTAMSRDGKYLHLAYRSSKEPWTLNYQRASLETDPPIWSHFGFNGKTLLRAPSPGYCYWTNSLAMDANGTLHLLAEFFKLIDQQRRFGYSPAVTHLYSEDQGESWKHTDGRQLDPLPGGLENITPILFRGGGDLRPSGLHLLSDQSLVFTIIDRSKQQLLFCRKRPGKEWEIFDWTKQLQKNISDKYFFCYHAQLAENKQGRLQGCTVVAPEQGFGHPKSQLVHFVVDKNLENLEIVEILPFWRENHPDWLPRMFPAPHDSGKCLLLHQSGNRGEKNINTQKTEVVLRVV